MTKGIDKKHNEKMSLPKQRNRTRYKNIPGSVDYNTYEHFLRPYFRFSYNRETQELLVWGKMAKSGKLSRTLQPVPLKAETLRVSLTYPEQFTSRGEPRWVTLVDIYKKLHTLVKDYSYGKKTRGPADPLEKVINRILYDGALQDSLRVELSDIVPFTNDPRKYNLAFFDPATLDDLEKVEPLDWLGFESQIPDDLKRVFRAFIYSIFVPENRSRQILILQDTGQTGKSTVLNALQKFLNTKIRPNLAQSVSQGSLDDKFWGSKVYDKRLLVFGDSANEYLVKKDKIKQLTGGDFIPVEHKGQASFSFQPNAKIIVGTNTPVEVSNLKESEWSRVILIPLGEQDQEYKKKYIVQDEGGNKSIVGHKEAENWFYEQLPSYLLLCKPSFDELCPTGANIILPPNYLEKYIQGSSSNEQVYDFELLLKDYIEVTEKEGDHLPSSDIMALIDYLKDKQVLNPDYSYKADFYGAILRHNPKVRSKHKDNKRGFKGLKLKNGIRVLDNGKIVLD